MTENNFTSQFPRKQIKPYDGMSVTADVWAQAHDEHRQALFAHTSFLHGAGIITGLDVTANDPPGQIVFISPGVAIDQTGHIIVVPETVSYDFGNSAEGVLYLMLGYGEREIGEENTEPCYLQSEYVIAARPALPKRPAVELARITIVRAKKVIQNADNPFRPAQNELDLRFRQSTQVGARQILRVAVCKLGHQNKDILRGWDCLAKACQNASQYQVIATGDIPFSENLAEYDLVYIGCSGAFKVDASTLNALKHCISVGIPLVVESLEDSADSACQDLLTNLGQVVKPLGEMHPLLETPYLFARIPNGNRGNDVKVSAAAIYSTSGHCLAWAGRISGAAGSRSDIRDSHEWGLNVLHYCGQRRANA